MATLAPTSPAERTAKEIEDARIKVLTPGQLAWRRFLRHRAAVFGLVGMIALILFIIVGTVLIPVRRANKPNPANMLGTPTPITQWFSGTSADVHPFGTDATGDPAVTIWLTVIDDDDASDATIREIRGFIDAAKNELHDLGLRHWPYFRFRPAKETSAPRRRPRRSR